MLYHPSGHIRPVQVDRVEPVFYETCHLQYPTFYGIILIPSSSVAHMGVVNICRDICSFTANNLKYYQAQDWQY